jgi:PEGA domain
VTAGNGEAGGAGSRQKVVAASQKGGGTVAGLPVAPSLDVASGDAVEPVSQRRVGVGTVTVTSDPDGAELFVDDKFVGNSPAKLKLAAGPHTIALRCKACVEWKREIEVMKDSQVNLDGVLRED